MYRARETFPNALTYARQEKLEEPNKIVVNAPTGTKSVHAFATGTPELRVKTLALSRKRGCEAIDVKRTKNTANMLEENSETSPIIIINNATDRIRVRVEWAAQ